MRVITLVTLLCLAATPVLAGSTMAIWADTGAGLSPEITTRGGVNFDIVVTLDSDGSDALAAEFIITEMRALFPGVLALATEKINDTELDLGANELGEYMLAFQICAASSDRIELVRITYNDYNGVIGSQSALLTLRGFETGDSQPSSFSGSPGFVDCSLTKHGSEMGGHENGGALCVNCFEPPANEASMTDLKSNF